MKRPVCILHVAGVSQAIIRHVSTKILQTSNKIKSKMPLLYSHCFLIILKYKRSLPLQA
jgi:hypothetical protein